RRLAQLGAVREAAGAQVVDAVHEMLGANERRAEVRAEKAGPAGDENPHDEILMDADRTDAARCNMYATAAPPRLRPAPVGVVPRERDRAQRVKSQTSSRTIKSTAPTISILPVESGRGRRASDAGRASSASAVRIAATPADRPAASSSVSNGAAEGSCAELIPIVRALGMRPRISAVVAGSPGSRSAPLPRAAGVAVSVSGRAGCSRRRFGGLDALNAGGSLAGRSGE